VSSLVQIFICTLLSVMGAFAEFERSLIRERQREGIELAKKRGAYKGRKPILSNEQIIKIKELSAIGVAKTKIAREFGVSRQTVYGVLETAVGGPTRQLAS